MAELTSCIAAANYTELRLKGHPKALATAAKQPAAPS